MNYTQQANEVLQSAKKMAKELKHPYIGTEHLLLGLRKVLCRGCRTDSWDEWCKGREYTENC